MPETGAALSAAGALLSDLGTDFAITAVMRTDAYDQATADRVIDELTRRCRAFAERSGLDRDPTIEYGFDGRYFRQNWDLEVPLELSDGRDAEALATSFHRLHERVFAISEPNAPVQVTTWRARVKLEVTDISGRRTSEAGLAAAAQTHRRVLFGGQDWLETPVLHLRDLPDGHEFPGPAVIESPFTTIVVDPGCVGHKTCNGSIVLLPTGAGAG